MGHGRRAEIICFIGTNSTGRAVTMPTSAGKLSLMLFAIVHHLVFWFV